MDEKGFIIGICHAKKRVVSKEMLASGKLLGAVQDGSREFVTLLACICADGTALPPALIYQGTSGDLQDTWLEDYDASKDEAYFASSQKGWTNENLGVSWLEKVFIGTTSAKAGLHNRMLIVDGHASHVNWRFIELCDKNLSENCPQGASGHGEEGTMDAMEEGAEHLRQLPRIYSS